MSFRLSSLLRLAAAALPALAVACGDGMENAAPIIDSVEAPLRVTETDGIYAIPVTMLFHDNDGEAITHLRYRLPPNIDAMIDVPAPNPTRESAAVTIIVRAADLDGDVPVTRSQSDSGEKSAAAAKDEAEAKRGRERSRNRPRALQLSVVDYRGAESLPLSRTVILD